MEALLDCLVLFVVASPLYQNSEAVSQADADRALITYSLEFDGCKEITDSSPSTSKRAADDACEKSFQALDNLKLNTCHGWRNAGCRLISGQKYRQCTCLVSYCDDLSIKNAIPTPFRQCAVHVWTQQRSTLVRPTPVTTSQQRKRKHDDLLQTSQKRRAFMYSDYYGGAGTSYDKFSFGGAGSAFAAYTSGEAGSSSRIQITGGSGLPSFLQEPAPAAVYLPRPYTCTICQRSYRTEPILKEHIKSHTTDDTKCFDCDRVFATKGSLKLHKKTAHSEAGGGMGRGRPRTRESSGPFYCRVCGKRYAYIGARNDHEKSHKTLETHCFHCKRTFASKGSYRVHLRRDHPEDAKAEEAAEYKRYLEENPEVCGQCNKRFKNEEGLRQHRMVHEGKTECDLCGAVFSRRSGLYIHRKRDHK